MTATEWTAIFGVLLTAVTSLGVAVYNATRSSKSQAELADQQATLGRELAVQQHRMDELRAERDALRDYEYEARKRLYTECEPLLFQLVESSEQALRRIKALAQLARDEVLLPSGVEGWLRSSGYYLSSTVYIFLAPLAIWRLIRRQLTSVDLVLDPRMGAQYELAKRLFVLFTDDHTMARCDPPLSDGYVPFHPDAASKQAEHPARYRR